MPDRHDQSVSRCSVCNEVIPVPVPRANGEIICEDCYDPTRRSLSSGPRESGEGADRQYEGDRFHSGEW